MSDYVPPASIRPEAEVRRMLAAHDLGRIILTKLQANMALLETTTRPVRIDARYDANRNGWVVELHTVH